MRKTILTALIIATPVTAAAAQARALTTDDYARAERRLGTTATSLVTGLDIRPTWLRDGRMWYSVTSGRDTTFVIVDPVKKSKTKVDRAQLVAAGVVRLGGGGAGGRGRGGAGSTSPNGERMAFIRDYNLWVRDITTSKETQLTTDGVKDFGYATNNAGWTKSDEPVLTWSPDSRKIATFQHDGRGVSEMYLVNTTAGAPKLQAWKYPLPGDSVIFRIQRVIIDLDAPGGPKLIRLQMPPDQHRSTVSDHIACGARICDVLWYPDGSSLAFVSSSRDHKHAWMRVADATTGAVRTLFEETSATQINDASGVENWRVLPASKELVWWSERENWGQLYLYDLATGQPKNRITSGDGNASNVEYVDEKSRTIFFTGVGKEAGRDPYYRHFYRVGLDGKKQTLLTPEIADHTISLSPDAKYFVDTYSTWTTPPTTVLRDASGKLILELEKADASALLATGWRPPTSFSFKGRDGKTDVYGVMFTPKNLDSTKKYPVIDYIYPGPQSGSIGSRSFAASHRDNEALTELGFIVVAIDGMGTPDRSKAFHDAYYGDMGDNTLPDQVLGIKELARRYPWVDADKVGIWGHSGGGFATASAMFRYPDFFKVGISESGNHDNRVYEDDWGERYQGLLTRGSGPSDNYYDEANQTHAANLKGKLLLAHGGLDDNVPPYNTTLVVEALEKANKDFDLVMFPNARHGYAQFGNYMMRRRWDYFVKNLLGAEPPKEYEIGRQRPIP